MRFAPAALVAFCLAVPSSAMENAEFPEDIAHHGYAHVDGESEGHHHGDADDHHEDPGSPCHHHEAQVCSGHGNDIAASTSVCIVEPGLMSRFHLVTVEPDDSHSVHLIFHIPIA